MAGLSRSRLAIAAAVCCTALQAGAATHSAVGITTYHYDNLRTGWNQAETVLNAANVASSSFGLQQQVALDEQVDAQPLFLSGQTIAGGTFDVVYVATENNTLYAIDANSGRVLLSQNYGAPVPISALPGQCNNNSNNIGINSTPVIDISTGTLYAVTYTYENRTPTFRLHAIDVTTLQDKTPSVDIAASAVLKNGKPIGFKAGSQRQRPALIETGGAIYAGFGSFCDFDAGQSRGWVLGWKADTLAPLPVSALLNQKPHSPDNFLLSSVWMSGYGLSSDDQGSLYFITGNSDFDGKSYNSTYNLDESVVKLSTDLTTVQSFFTPKGGPDGWANFDRSDTDFGSGGALLLPDQAGAYPHLAVAAGKGGPMYLLNRDDLGGLGNQKVTLGAYDNKGCWCGQSYYVGADGVGRVVESSGESVDIWKVKTSSGASLVHDATAFIAGGQDPGFFTTISSNGTQTGSHVIWAVGRPTNTNPADVTLYAFDPANHAARLFSATAGTWPWAGHPNANLVPVAAGGHVFVASYANLSIFGLTPPGLTPKTFAPPPAPARLQYRGAPHQVTGVVVASYASTLSLRTRNGATVQVNVAAARDAGRYAAAQTGHAALVRGDYANGVLVAGSVLHAKSNPAMWGDDW
jgi:hypothetical protein